MNRIPSRDSAAAVIQAAWKGYITRQRLKDSAREKRQVLQDLEAEEVVGRTDFGCLGSSEKDAEMKKRLRSLAEMTTFHEKQMSRLERVPASEITSFLRSQRMSAATRIQLWWRSKVGRGREKGERWAQQQLGAPGSCTRESLQAEIVKYCKEHPPPSQSEAQFRHTHDKVQQLLTEFYSRKTSPTWENSERKAAFFSHLEHDCNLLLSAPRLSEAGDDWISGQYSSGSEAIARMAHQMHCAELRATKQL